MSCTSWGPDPTWDGIGGRIAAPTRCVNLGNLLRGSVPQFPHL